jgi:Thioredoxin-like domain
MRLPILIALALAATLAVHADEKFPTLKVGDITYTNVTVTEVSSTDIFFTWPGGMGNAKIKELSPDLQQHFNFDPARAKAVELKQAGDQAKYHDALLHQPAVRPPDMSRGPGSAQPADALWRSDLPGAQRQAVDWCPWCIKFEQDVLSKPQFTAYAGQKLELVKVDFPRHTPLPADQQQANDELAKRFGVNGYPTYVLLSSAGQELGRQVGYQQGGPDAFIAELEKFSGR